MLSTDHDRRHPLHVVVYSVNYAPEMTGIGRYTGELVEKIAGEGIRCTVITSPPHYPQWQILAPYRNRFEQERGPGVDVLRCPLYIARNVRGLTRLLAPISFALTSAPVAVWTILRRRPDIVFCVEPTLFAAPAALLASRLVGSRTVLHVQDLEIDGALEVGHLKRDGLIERIAHLFERTVLRSFDRVVTISNAMRRRLIDKGVDIDRLSIIRNWVDTGAIYPLHDTSYRRQLGIADDAFLVLYAGSVGAKQGIGLLCEAVATIAPSSKIVLAIVGEGPRKAELVSQFGAHPHIRFYGLQPENSLNGLLNSADLHVIPQLQGATDFALPSKLGGILASGRPLLVFGQPQQEIAEFVKGVAEIVEPTDSLAISATLLRLAEERSSGSSEARVALADELSMAKAISRFIGLFRQLKAKNGRPRTGVFGETK